MSTALLERPKSEIEAFVDYDEDGIPILPNGFEFVHGQLVEGAVSELCAWVSGRLNFRLQMWLEDRPIGVLFNGTSEQGFQCFPFLPEQIRRPDAAFVRRDLSAPFLSTKGYTKDVPELIAEVISPEDRIEDLEEKLNEFRRAGTKLMWVIYPMQRTAKVIHSNGIAIPIDENGFLDGEDVLPGLSIPLSSILPPKSAK